MSSITPELKNNGSQTSPRRLESPKTCPLPPHAMKHQKLDIKSSIPSTVSTEMSSKENRPEVSNISSCSEISDYPICSEARSQEECNSIYRCFNILMSIQDDSNDVMTYLNENPRLKIITAALYSYFWDNHKQAKDNKKVSGKYVNNAIENVELCKTFFLSNRQTGEFKFEQLQKFTYALESKSKEREKQKATIVHRIFNFSRNSNDEMLDGFLSIKNKFEKFEIKITKNQITIKENGNEKGIYHPDILDFIYDPTNLSPSTMRTRLNLAILEIIEDQKIDFKEQKTIEKKANRFIQSANKQQEEYINCLTKFQKKFQTHINNFKFPKDFGTSYYINNSFYKRHLGTIIADDFLEFNYINGAKPKVLVNRINLRIDTIYDMFMTDLQARYSPKKDRSSSVGSNESNSSGFSSESKESDYTTSSETSNIDEEISELKN